MATGPLILGDLTPITNIDPADFARYEFADGVSYADAVAYLNQQVARFAARDYNSKLVSVLMEYLCKPPTTEQAFEFATGSITWENSTEFAAPNPQRLSLAGGVVVPRMRAGSFGVTRQSYRKLRSDQWIATMQAWVNGAVDEIRKDLFRRIYTWVTAISHPSGNGSVSPGWIGGGSQNFVAPPYEGSTFSSDSHGIGSSTDTSAGRDALIAAALLNLTEHGYQSTDDAPIMLLHGSATLADVQAMTGYASWQSSMVRYPTGYATPRGEQGAVQVPLPLTVAHGVLEAGNLLCVNCGGGVPDNYFAVVKSFGRNSPLNPIVHWVASDTNGGMDVSGLQSSPPANESPFANVQGEITYGFGVGDPAAGCVAKIGAASYDSDPTIS